MHDDLGLIDGRIPPTVYNGQTYAAWCAVHSYDPAAARTREAYTVAPRSADPAPEVAR
ncbi:hypothetical protein ACPPVO_08180 [Dactylosporangium sp. McL0621]|uniref:hypothetical protein n=1 Tax=Dactylosporangium sp. McL0621 TaxID=3415678 RepID=UPI003CEBE552